MQLKGRSFKKYRSYSTLTARDGRVRGLLLQTMFNPFVSNVSFMLQTRNSMNVLTSSFLSVKLLLNPCVRSFFFFVHPYGDQTPHTKAENVSWADMGEYLVF